MWVAEFWLYRQKWIDRYRDFVAETKDLGLVSAQSQGTKMNVKTDCTGSVKYLSQSARCLHVSVLKLSKFI